MRGKTVSVCTLGCRVNQYESDAIAEELECLGATVVPFGEKCDLVIVNTCSVTAESDRKSRQMVRRIKKINPDAKIIVTGCSLQIFPDEIRKIPGVSALVGNGAKNSVSEVAIKLLEDDGYAVDNIGDIEKAAYDGLKITHARRARAYVKIEDGCENKCAYCIIPKARGKIRSKAEEEVISEVEKLSGSCPEMILTGIETASYGKDRGEKDALASLLEKVDKISGVERLTVGSLDPNVLTDSFLETVKGLPSFLPHLHLSIQSGSSIVLSRMRRKYNAEKAIERILKTKETIPGITLSADIIVGFPGETEEEFLETVAFCEKAKFMHLHIFPYSKRMGTEAESMPYQVPEDIKHERARRLAEVGAKIKSKLLDEYIETYRNGGDEVLFEQQANGVNIGHSKHYIEVRVTAESDLSNKVVPVTLTHHDGEICYGKI